MNIIDELTPFPDAMRNFGNWYNTKANYSRPKLQDIFKYDFEVTIGLLLSWLYHEHGITIVAVPDYYTAYYTKDAVSFNMSSKYTNNGINICHGVVETSDIFESYKRAIVIVVSKLTETKTPF